KQTAKEKVNSVPSSTEGKADLQTRLDNIASVTSPEVNDADSNGMLDTDQLSEASQAVVSAEQAKTAVDTKLAEVTSDDLVTPDEKSVVDALVQTLENAKQTAKEKVNSVPSSTEGKADLQTRLDNIASVTSDGLVTPDEKAAVEALIQALECAKQTAKEKINNVPSSTEGKTDLQTRLDNIASVTSPEVNDADSNGVLDTEQLSEASQA